MLFFFFFFLIWFCTQLKFAQAFMKYVPTYTIQLLNKSIIFSNIQNII